MAQSQDINGNTINPATEDKQDAANTALAITAAAEGGICLASWYAAVDSTEAGKALATIKGSALHASTVYLRVRPQFATDDVRYNPIGPASAVSALLPPSGLTFAVSQSATLKLFSTAGANITVDEK